MGVGVVVTLWWVLYRNPLGDFMEFYLALEIYPWSNVARLWVLLAFQVEYKVKFTYVHFG